MSNIEFLLSRFSCDSLKRPAPNEEQLKLILSAAMRAPDHGRLRPWRFIVILDEYRQEWIKVLEEIMNKKEYNYPQTYIDKVIKNFTKAPLVLALGMRKFTEKTSVTVDEQLMASSAAVMNILNAVHAMEFGAKWITGPIDNPELVSALGMQEPYKIMGFMFIGTPEEKRASLPRVAIDDYVAIWKGEPVHFDADSDK